MKTTCTALLAILLLLTGCGGGEPKTGGMEVYEYYPDGTVKSIGNYIDGKQRKRTSGFRIAETYGAHEMYPLLDSMGFFPLLSGGETKYLANCVGYATKEQKERIDQILLRQSPSKFGKDVQFAWSMSLDEMNGIKYYSLYALKPASAMSTNVTYKDLSRVRKEKDEQMGRNILNITMTNAGKVKFGKLTSDNISKPLAIVFDDVVLSAPVVNEAIHGGQIVVSGSFTVQEVSELEQILNNSILNGEYREYHPNGKLKTIMTYENGEQTGSYSRYDQNGKLIKQYGS